MAICSDRRLISVILCFALLASTAAKQNKAEVIKSRARNAMSKVIKLSKNSLGFDLLEVEKGEHETKTNQPSHFSSFS